MYEGGGEATPVVVIWLRFLKQISQFVQKFSQNLRNNLFLFFTNPRKNSLIFIFNPSIGVS
jgi:hypothetical protein